MRESLDNSGLRVGILIQSTIGHGVASDARFTRSVNAKGTVTQSMCPLDPDFQNYIRNVIEIAASAKPSFMLVDDDFRLANHGAPGCYCKLHLAAMEKAAARKFTREELLNSISSNTEESVKLKKIWEQVRLESLLALAGKIREGIDAVNPEIPCGLCICDAGGMELHFAHDIEKALAGKQKPFVRINNAWYWNQDAKGLYSRLYWTAAQIQNMQDMPEILAESDTYPQNRYSTPAKALNTQIIFSIAGGCTGLKLWISRLYGFEPGSGQAYREIMKENLGLYRELRRLVPKVTWDGPAVPLYTNPANIPSAGHPIRNENWTCSVIGHIGIPCRIGADKTTDIFMLTGAEVAGFTDQELKYFLSRNLLIDGAASEELSKRGLSTFTGVNSDSPADWKADLECPNDDPVNGKARNREFIISALSPGLSSRLKPIEKAEVRILSTIYSSPFYCSSEKKTLGPGLVLFENSIGGRVATFSCKPGFTTFLNEIRREQLYGVMTWLNRKPLPVIVDSDIDIYSMHGTVTENNSTREILCIFNMNMDSLDEIRLRTSSRIEKIEVLMSNGSWKAAEINNSSDSTVTVKHKLENSSPAIFKIQR